MTKEGPSNVHQGTQTLQRCLASLEEAREVLPRSCTSWSVTSLVGHIPPSLLATSMNLGQTWSNLVVSSRKVVLDAYSIIHTEIQ